MLKYVYGEYLVHERSECLLVGGRWILIQWVFSGAFACSKRRFLLDTLQIDLVFIEEGVKSVSHILMPAQLILVGLFSSSLEVPGNSRFSKSFYRRILSLRNLLHLNLFLKRSYARGSAVCVYSSRFCYIERYIHLLIANCTFPWTHSLNGYLSR